MKFFHQIQSNQLSLVDSINPHFHHLVCRLQKPSERHQSPVSNNHQFNSLGPPSASINSGQPMMYTTGPYADPNYLQMAIGAYLTPSASGYKCVDPYFLSQGETTLDDILLIFSKVNSIKLLSTFPCMCRVI